MNKNKASLIFVLLFIPLLLINIWGCSKQSVSQSQPEETTDLQSLMPAETGFVWVYNGFAEYGHRLYLSSIDIKENQTVYHLQGEVDDASGGEAERDYNLEIEYVIKDGVLLLQNNTGYMMDTFPEMELIKTPLEKGTVWEQKVKDKDGKDYILQCTIDSVEEAAQGKIYTVLYEDNNSQFYEKRVFEEGIGLLSFEKLFIFEPESFSAGYFLYQEISGPPEKKGGEG